MNIKTITYLNFIKKLWFRILVVLLITSVLLISVSNFYIKKEIKEQDSLEKFTYHLDERIPAIMKDYDIPGVNIALVKRGKTVWSKAYGYADFKGKRKMTTDTYCRVESISKPVTAWGVMKLVKQGKIELDKPVVKYLNNWEFPESNYSENKVTVRQLLTHSSGMPLGNYMERYSPRGKKPSLEENLYKEAIIINEPGKSFLYSDTGFNLLELLIEEVTGRDFAEYMEKEVLIPLGMHNSSFSWSEEFNSAVPVGHDLKGNPVPVYVYPGKASGNLFATVEDIATFVTAGMTNFYYKKQEVLDQQSINKLYTQGVGRPGIYGLAFDSYGFGHFIEIFPDGTKAVSHGGQGAGLMTHFHSVPETGDGIVILTNSQRSWPFFAYILTSWAQWCGFSSVGMSKIIIGQKLIWGFIAVIFFVFLWQIWKMGLEIFSGSRHFRPFSKKSRLLRMLASLFSIILVTWLFWAISQDYLFVSALFPIASSWLGVSIFLIVLILLLYTLFPCEE